LITEIKLIIEILLPCSRRESVIPKDTACASFRIGIVQFIGIFYEQIDASRSGDIHTTLPRNVPI
jgi:hypothetical protein